MPCMYDDSRYGNAHDKERTKEMTMSKVFLLLDELDGKGPPDYHRFYHGYDIRASGEQLSQKECDDLTANLCQRIQAIPDLTKYSLEMQMWWRDHQEQDRKRREDLESVGAGFKTEES